MSKNLIAVLIGSQRQRTLVRAGYRVHHIDGGVAYMFRKARRRQ